MQRLWGLGKSASADGMKWDLYPQNLMSTYHVRYGGKISSSLSCFGSASRAGVFGRCSTLPLMRFPQEVEDQITCPLTVNLQGLPGVKVVRSSSAFGFSMIFVIFNDDVDLYFARTRVLELHNLVTTQLPAGVVPTLGPDAKGVGHVFWYTVEGGGRACGTFARCMFVTNSIQCPALQRLRASAARCSNTRSMSIPTGCVLMGSLSAW
jgi:AcrB/AcrD/AcrF family/Tn3 transposase DDE domain